MSMLADLRKTYARGALSEDDVLLDPLAQFRKWLDEALHAQVPEPNAMSVATVDENGQPSSRIVLIKEVDDRGFVFYTNYHSHKGRDLAQNARCALLFHWVELERQVRIEGIAEQVSAEQSDAYFHSRPLDSRIGAWASAQSEPLSSRTHLVAKAAEYGLRFMLNPPRPPHWGGYRVIPQTIEFWQGRPSRLHDRIQFKRKDLIESDWTVTRLSP
jgi:pyridoxamine 5'-phosphate oxidase